MPQIAECKSLGGKNTSGLVGGGSHGRYSASISSKSMGKKQKAESIEEYHNILKISASRSQHRATQFTAVM